MAALTVYPTGTASGATLTTADTLVTAAPNAETSHTSKTGKLTGWGVLQSQGNVNAWAAGGSEPAAADVHGFILDNTSLEGLSLAAGTYTINLKVSTSSGTVTGVLHARLWKRSSGGVFTAIADGASASTGFTSTAATITITASGVAEMPFAVGDKLYLDVLLNITANSSASTTATTSLFQNLSTTGSVVTPGTVQRFAYTGTTAASSAVTSTYFPVLQHLYTGHTVTTSGVSGSYGRILTHPYVGSVASVAGSAALVAQGRAYVGSVAASSAVTSLHSGTFSYAGTTSIHTNVIAVIDEGWAIVVKTVVQSSVTSTYGQTNTHPYSGSATLQSITTSLYSYTTVFQSFAFVGRTSVLSSVIGTYVRTNVYPYAGSVVIRSSVSALSEASGQRKASRGGSRSSRMPKWIPSLTVAPPSPITKLYEADAVIGPCRITSIYNYIPDPWTQQDEELLLVSNLLAA